MKIIATVCNCGQIGMDEFRDYHVSNIFNGDSKISDIIAWANKVLGKNNAGICDIKFSEIVE